MRSFNYAVIGLGFGDEGKGVVVDFLANEINKYNMSSIVIRFSGGHQVSHTVVHSDKRHIFTNYGSGTMRNVPTYWSSNCTIDPIGLYNEYNILKSNEIKPKLYISNECQVTTPLDQIANFNSEDLQNGTVGVGFGKTKEREENYYSLVAEDLKYSKIFEFKMKAIENYYSNIIKVCAKEYIKKFKKSCQWLIENKDIEIINYNILETKDNLIYEGSQGLLLDKNIGFFPHVTRDNTDLTNIKDVIIDEIFFVTRAYQTRHGNGPMTNLDLPIPINKDPNETNKNNCHQGKFRITMLDLDLIKYGLSRFKGKYKNKNLVVTCLEHMKEYCYTINGSIYKFPNKESFIKSIQSYLNFKNCLYFENYKGKILNEKI